MELESIKVYQVREQAHESEDGKLRFGKLRFEGIVRDQCIAHAQSIFRDERLVCVIDELDVKPKDWTKKTKK